MKKFFEDTGHSFDILLYIAGILVLALLAVLLSGCGGMQEQYVPPTPANSAQEVCDSEVQALVDAVEKQDIEKVAELLAGGLDINAKDKRGDSLLHMATRTDNKELVEFLIGRGADVNASGRYGVTPLHRAAVWAKDGEFVRLLIDKGADVDARDGSGETPLHRAAGCSNRQAAAALLANGADANAADSEGMTPLEHAAADIFDFGVYNLIYKHAGRSGEPGRAELLHAAKCGDVCMLKKLIDSGADLSVKHPRLRSSLLHVAARFGEEQAARLLLENGVYADERDMLWRTPLHLAVRDGREEVVKLLASAGSNVHAPDEYGRTPLHTAVVHGHKKAAAVLLECGADAAVEDESGRTPLDLAREKGHDEIVKLLQGRE